MASVTAIILTYNEEKHIERCIRSLTSFCERICVVDSFSTDRTIDIAKSLGAEVFQNPWEQNYAKQLNWGIEHCQIKTDWTLRIDADEYFTPELQQDLIQQLPSVPPLYTGIEVIRKVFFKGSWIRFGGFYPIHLLRLWRTGKGICEQRLMDEHIILEEGEVLRLSSHVVDENLNPIHWWVTKHNNYARREAADALNTRFQLTFTSNIRESAGTKQAVWKRILKDQVYNRLPLGLRPLLYFLFRFFVQLGFLDKPKVWLFHVLQGFWYRLIVDINIYEAIQSTQGDPDQLRQLIQEEWGIKF